jgi:hypothetical protein
MGAVEPPLQNFLIVGAMKSGTTSLATYTDQLPELEAMLGRDLFAWRR